MSAKTIGNSAAVSALVASAAIWIIVYSKWLAPFWVFATLGVITLVLPIVAGWKSSKRWLFLLALPVIGYIIMLAHTCG
jgi:hypothetical protein